MSRLIDGVISELQGIRSALGHDAPHPGRRPHISSRTPTIEQTGSGPIIDSSQWDVADQRRWEEEKQRARREVEGEGNSSRSGIEALAWYVSFHHNQQDWGIYIPLSSLALMDELYLSRLRMSRDRRLGLAWSILLHHERMHFAVDYACAQFELLLRAPIRRALTERFDPKLSYEVSAPEPYLKIEETAANGHMLRQMERAESKTTMRAIQKFVGLQPSGYREGLGATLDADFTEAVAETIRSYLALWAIEYRLDVGSYHLDLVRWLPLDDERALTECPVYVIDDLDHAGISGGSLRFITCIPNIVETEEFAKQLRRLTDPIRKAWLRKKEQFKVSVPNGADFKKFQGLWSLRVDRSYRAHLEEPDRGTTDWKAVAIGSHKQMGHG